tara:strand:+ start:173 stop:370 length:198 start_codon:yes stop_codon:yes gene_type:complete
MDVAFKSTIKNNNVKNDAMLRVDIPEKNIESDDSIDETDFFLKPTYTPTRDYKKLDEVHHYTVYK